jgi:hypothetical protein
MNDSEKIEIIAQAVAKNFEKNMIEAKTAHAQMYLVTYIGNPKTFALPEISAACLKAGIVTKLDFDGKFYSSSFKDVSGQLIDSRRLGDIWDGAVESALNKLKPLMLPETIDLGKRICPEYASVWR